MHILNLGAARTATLEGVPDGDWQATETAEAAQYQQGTALRPENGRLNLNLPARSLVSLNRQAASGGGQQGG